MAIRPLAGRFGAPSASNSPAKTLTCVGLLTPEFFDAPASLNAACPHRGEHLTNGVSFRASQPRTTRCPRLYLRRGFPRHMVARASRSRHRSPDRSNLGLGRSRQRGGRLLRVGRPQDRPRRCSTKIGRGGPTEIPAVLVARLALSENLRGHGLGEVLLVDALARIVDATQTVAARLVVVDDLHERVAQFYESLGFRRIPDSLLHVQKLSDIEAALLPPG